MARLKKERRSWISRWLRRIVYKNYGHNLLYQLQLRALNESVDYVQANMPEAMIYESFTDYLRAAIKEAPADGQILEFGVAGGNSIRKIAALAPNRQVHGFDSFEGLPEDWSGALAKKGQFSQNKKLPKVPSNVTFHVGWFDDTLPGFVKENTDPISLLHVDCDLYGGTKIILTEAAHLIRPGTMVLFDEYFNYPSWRHHEYKAWQEFVAEHEVSYTYTGVMAQGWSVAVRVDAIGRPATA
tara:strand:- start:12411 stop:13133 length:723 start_codon:yes stop_codon:yes gene_type:complete